MSKPKILKKINDYVIFIERKKHGDSYSISEWQEYPSGKTFFCHSGMIHYRDIIEQTGSPLAGFLDSEPLPSTIEELVVLMKKVYDDEDNFKEQQIQEKAEAKKIMRKFLEKGMDAGKPGDLEVIIKEFDIKKLTITTQITSNFNWEHVFNLGRRILWRHINSNIWEAKTKKKSGQGAQSLMYLEDGISFERDS